MERQVAICLPVGIYIREEQFSIIALTDGSGAITERYSYSAYGEPMFCSASGTEMGDSAEDNRLLFTGREWDEQLDLYHFRARMYDASCGRFCGRDQIGYFYRSYELYAFVILNPLKFLDPSGMAPQQPTLFPTGTGTTFPRPVGPFVTPGNLPPGIGGTGPIPFPPNPGIGGKVAVRKVCTKIGCRVIPIAGQLVLIGDCAVAEYNCGQTYVRPGLTKFCWWVTDFFNENGEPLPPPRIDPIPEPPTRRVGTKPETGPVPPGTEPPQSPRQGGPDDCYCCEIWQYPLGTPNCIKGCSWSNAEACWAMFPLTQCASPKSKTGQEPLGDPNHPFPF